MVEKWNKVMSVRKYFYALFKNYGIPYEGLSLIELSMATVSSDFGLYLVWNIPKSTITVSLYTKHVHNKIVQPGKLIAAYSVTDVAIDFLRNFKVVTEKEVLKALFTSYPIQQSDITEIISRKAIYLTDHYSLGSEDSWQRACLELSEDGYFDGIENIYSVLAECDRVLLPDNQRIVVWGTTIVDRYPSDSYPGRRVMRCVCVTVGLFRRMFVKINKQPFSLEWFNDHCDMRLVSAMMGRNRAPVIICGHV